MQVSNSLNFIGLEALEISVVPSQNTLNPPPVPKLSTIGVFVFLIEAYSSATKEVKGYTVDEPAIFKSAALKAPQSARFATLKDRIFFIFSP